MQHLRTVGAAGSEVEAILRESLANSRAGKPCIITPGSEIGERFAVAYEKWMQLRARAGSPFALSLGYGRAQNQETPS